jgi:glycosyltransferase involved in cell wall biosynthesis
LRSSVAAKGLDDRVWLPGVRDDVADVLRGFSVFVLPSLSEAAPITILEAMATALPVVASRVGGVPQLVPDGQAGVLVEPDDAHALADALSVYIDDPERRIAHGLAGRAHVEAQYSVDAMVAGYLSLYDGRRRNAALLI